MSATCCHPAAPQADGKQQSQQQRFIGALHIQFVAELGASAHLLALRPRPCIALLWETPGESAGVHPTAGII